MPIPVTESYTIFNSNSSRNGVRAADRSTTDAEWNRARSRLGESEPDGL